MHNCSYMASLVFFIKKKDSLLRLVQNYRALNTMTMKNKYPLPFISKLINKLQGVSKSLSPVEQNYKIHNKKMLAIVRALEEWRHFVEGAEHQVDIWT
jgi:RNase H-like domain found in reverse transcriptase